MNNLYEMEEAKSQRIVFVGTEKECIEFSKKNPDVKYNMIKDKDIKRK